MELARFIAFIALLSAGLAFEALAVFGVHRFHYCLNRLHAASMGDTLGVFCVMLAAVVYAGASLVSLKLICVLAIMWVTCPMSGHLIGLLAYKTDANLDGEAELWKR